MKTTDSNESYGYQYFGALNERLLRKMFQLLDLAGVKDDKKARVIAAAKRELEAHEEESET